jgi:hypothetical protein
VPEYQLTLRFQNMLLLDYIILGIVQKAVVYYTIVRTLQVTLKINALFIVWLLSLVWCGMQYQLALHEVLLFTPEPNQVFLGSPENIRNWFRVLFRRLPRWGGNRADSHFHCIHEFTFFVI